MTAGRLAAPRAASNSGSNIGMKSVMNPMANGPSVAARMVAISASIQSGPWPGLMPPNEPSPPAAVTAPARRPPLWRAIGADIIG